MVKKILYSILGIYFVIGILFNNYVSCKYYQKEGIAKWFFFDDLLGVRGLMWPCYLIQTDDDQNISGEEFKQTYQFYGDSILDSKNDYVLLTHFLGGAIKTQDSLFYDEFNQYRQRISYYSKQKQDSLKHFSEELIEFHLSYSESFNNSLSFYLEEGSIGIPTFDVSYNHLELMNQFGLPKDIIADFRLMVEEMASMLEEILREGDSQSILYLQEINTLQNTVLSTTMWNAYHELFGIHPE